MTTMTESQHDHSAHSNDGVTASACWECGEAPPPPMVYALGTIGYDFVTAARRDWFVQHGVKNPDDPAQMLAYLDEDPEAARAITWTLNQDATPIYGIQPGGAFASRTYTLLRQFLSQQVNEAVERVALPGWMEGTVQLSHPHLTVPRVWPESRGLAAWKTLELVHAVVGKEPRSRKDKEKSEEIENFLDRVYHEIRNYGVAPDERALNFAATSALAVERVFEAAMNATIKLDSIAVVPSPTCRPESNCWDVLLTFFNPAKRFEEARRVYRFTVDVSDVVPVLLGRVRWWHVY